MKTHELICIVDNGLHTPPDDQTHCVNVGPYTAILSTASRPLVSLPMSRAEAMRQAAARQALFERLLPMGTVVAAKPQLWLTPDQAATCLRANAGVLDETCAWLRHKAQFQIAVAWDAAQVLDRFRDTPEISPLFAAETTTPDALERAISRLRNRLGAHIRQLLDPVVTDIIALPITDDMLCNFAVLIPGKAEAQLDRCVEAIDAIWSDGFRIRQIGPSAAGSFALLDLAWVTADDIKAAHRLLSLDPGAPQDVVQSARRRALMTSQGDTSHIKHAARIVDATRQSGADGFHLATLLSEDQGLGDATWTAVA